MATTRWQPQSSEAAAPGRRVSSTSPAEISAAFQTAFGVAFSILEGSTGDLLHLAADQPARDWSVRAELARAVGRSGRPEVVEEGGPLVTLAVPISTPLTSDYVALATLVVAPCPAVLAELRAAGELIGLEPQDAREWISRQPFCSVEVLMRIAELLREKFEDRQRLNRLELEASTLAGRIASANEEASVLYCLIQHLRITADDDQLARFALEWLGNVAPSQGLAFISCRDETQSSGPSDAPRQSRTISRGQFSFDERSFAELVARCEQAGNDCPFVFNRSATSLATWLPASIHSVVCVPVASGGKLFGWLVAFNRHDADGFSQIDTNLFASVATILGVHRENTSLFREQSEFVAGVVHALTSAIDAKDPYTCGHSDRVARMAVRLGQQVGCTAEDLKTLYLAGLLHDVGKIGVEDDVLRKEGDLTDDEFDQIKRHPGIGCEILADLKRLKHVLPVVLHHHESWDGSGYPDGLAGGEIPRLARIIAVADSFDAMASDRPYRPGMPIEALEKILREGAGVQWDPEVVQAYFHVRLELIGMLQPRSTAAPASSGHWT